MKTRVCKWSLLRAFLPSARLSSYTTVKGPSKSCCSGIVMLLSRAKTFASYSFTVRRAHCTFCPLRSMRSGILHDPANPRCGRQVVAEPRKLVGARRGWCIVPIGCYCLSQTCSNLCRWLDQLHMQKCEGLNSGSFQLRD